MFAAYNALKTIKRMMIMRGEKLTCVDQGEGVTAERLLGGKHTADVYVGGHENQTYYKVIKKPALLALELFAGKIMDQMTQIINRENQASTGTNHPSSPRIRTPSPRVCISPPPPDANNDADEVILASDNIRPGTVTYEDCNDIGFDKIKPHLHQIVRIMTMRQLIQDGDAMGQNYEIPFTHEGVEATLSLDYGEAFSSIQSRERILPE